MRLRQTIATLEATASRSKERKSPKARLLAVALLASTPLLFPTSASALSNITIQSGDGDTLRAVFYEHRYFGGYALTYRGGSACSASTSDTDYSRSSMPWNIWGSWNDKVSSLRDYNSCDVKLYMDTGFGGPSTSWINAGGGGVNVPSGYNDQTSSFKIS